MFTTTQTEPTEIFVSYLRHIIKPNDGALPSLWQAKITDCAVYGSFTEFVDALWSVATYPKPQSNKFETYAFTPTLFFESAWRPNWNPEAKPRWGTWRAGEHSIHEVSLFCADLDNHRDDEPMIEFETVEADLRRMDLSYALYTSFSHLKKDGRHKVRILLPTNRTMTYEEAFYTYLVFDWMFHNQLDGSIYDDGDHLFGPTYGGRTAQWLDGGVLDVDAVLGFVADNLPDEALEPARHRQKSARVAREWTDAEMAEYRQQVADRSVSEGVTISNAAICRPRWLIDLDNLVNGGSHRQTLLQILTRIWIKSKSTLTFGEMQSLQAELDCRYYGYCARKYGSRELDGDICSIMTLRGSPENTHFDDVFLNKRFAANMKRLSRFA